MVGKDTERPGRGFLTDSNRDFLLSDREDYSKAERRQHRYQIRQNIKTALMDFQLLWELDDGDLIQAIGPLSAPLQLERIDTRVVEDDPSLAPIDLEEMAEEEGDIGQGMYNGMMQLFSLFAYMFGPEDYGYLAERALNGGMARNALRVGEKTGIFDLQLHPADPNEKLSEYGEL